MSKHIPDTTNWVAKQVELYEGSNRTQRMTLTDSGLPVIIVTHRGSKSRTIHKTPWMRAIEDGIYILGASMSAAPKNPVWYYNLKAETNLEFRDDMEVFDMRVREVSDSNQKQRLWEIAVAAYLPHQE